MSGVATALAFDPVGMYPLVFAGVAGLVYAVAKARTLRDAALVSGIWGTAFYLVLVSWLGSLLGLFWLPLPLALYEGALVALAGMAGWVLAGTRERPGTIWVIIAALFVGDRMRGAGQFGFPWGELSVSLAGTPLRGALALAGHAGASFLVLLVGGALAWAARERTRRSFVVAMVAIAIFVLASGSGLRTKADAVRTVRVAAVSEKLTPQEKHSPDLIQRETVFVPRFEKLLGDALARHPDIVVFPESAFPGDLGKEPAWLDKLTRLSKGGPTIIVGSAVAVGKRDYNRLFVFDEGRVHTYDKRTLVPFGEYLPYPEWLSFVRRWGAVSEFTPGTSSPVVKTKLGKIGLGICWESALPGAGAERAREGARLLVFATNDNWFGHGGQSAQHWQWTKSQSDASGLPVIQSANAGRTGVYEDGKSRELPDWTSGVLVANVRMRAPLETRSEIQRFVEQTAIFLSLSTVLVAAAARVFAKSG